MLKQTLKGLGLVVTFLFATSCGVRVLHYNSSVLSSEKNIVEFSLIDVAGTIGEGDITVLLPYGTNTSALEPTIVVSDKATVSPGSMEPQDFKDSVLYTVTAEDGSTKEYTVTATIDSLTCEDAAAAFSAALGNASCTDASLYLSAFINGDCIAGNNMDFIVKMTQYTNAGCPPTCSERSALAYAYMGIGDSMSAAQQINWMAHFGLCTAECIDLTTHYTGNPASLLPCE